MFKSVDLEQVSVSEKGSTSKGRTFYEYVMVFAKNEPESSFETIVKNLHGAGLRLQYTYSRDDDEIFLRIGCEEERLDTQAELIGIRLPLNEKEGVTATGSAAFTIENKAEFRGYNFEDSSKPFFSSSKRQQIILSIIASPPKKGGAGLDYAKLLFDKKILHFFPLHDFDDLDKLKSKWAGLEQLRNVTRILDQPLDEVRNYFGEYVAMYFAWLGFYTQALVPISIFGFIVLMVQIGEGIDNVLVPIYCILLSLWATFFLEFWKRRQSTLAWKWSAAGVEDDEPVRPSFDGDRVVSRITGEEEVHYPAHKRYFKLAVSYPLIMSILSAVITATLGILVLRIILARTSSMSTIGPILAGCLNAVSIVILDQLYLNVAYRLNEWENYRTETQFEDNLIVKNFLFQFINSYVSLFYIAFAKESEPVIFGEKDQCNGSCMQELLTQLATIFATKMFVQQAMESLIPYLKMRILTWKENRDLAAGTELKENDVDITTEESQSKRETYKNAFDDYNEMIIQFGYVTLFAAAFPIASALAFANNIVEIRTDALKLCTSFKRPFYRTVEDIGTYYYTLEVMSTIAVITNCCILAFTSNIFIDEGYVEEGDTSKKMWIALIAEHIILILKFAISVAIPDVPQEIREEMLCAKYHQEKTMQSGDRKEKERTNIERHQSRMNLLGESGKFDQFQVDRSEWLKEPAPKDRI